MELSQADRDALRNSQHLINPKHAIGNIIEHKVQNPKAYKKLSNQLPTAKSLTEQAGNKFDVSKVQYKSQFLENAPQPLVAIYEDSEELDYPIALEDVHSNLWLNMGQIEFDKLEWMSGKAQKAHQEQLKGTTIFDKDGRAIPSGKPVDGSAALGQQLKECHDIPSLVNLLDSVYQPQVTYALNVIEKIAALSTMGYYDGAFDENIHEILIKNCLLRVRHQLDSPNESICQSALRCLRALICNTQVDEVILDRIHPLISETADSNLWLRNNSMKAEEFTPEMKDARCVEIDSILALIQRTDIITRFNHLIRVKNGTFGKTYYNCILDILIRMARHSVEVCRELQCLLKLIIERFLPPEVSKDTRSLWGLSSKALKLVRIIAESSQLSVSDEIKKCQIPISIIPVVQAYLFIDSYGDTTSAQTDEDSSFKLMIENLRLLKALYKMPNFRNDIGSLLAMGRSHIWTNLKSLGQLQSTKQTNSKISLDWQYAAHLTDLIGLDITISKLKPGGVATVVLWMRNVKQILFQWLADLIREQCIPHLDVSIAIASIIKNHEIVLFETKGTDNELDKVMMQYHVNSKNHSIKFFKLLTGSMSRKSKLDAFMEITGNKRDPKSLPSFGFVNFNTGIEYEFKLSPVIDIDSPYILLNTYIERMQQFDKNLSDYDIHPFISDLNFIRQMKSVTGYQKFDIAYELLAHQSFLAQYEVGMIANSILLLGRYFLGDLGTKTPAGGSAEVEETLIEFEPGVKGNELECYSNLCYYAISALGLLHTNQDSMASLKDKIFEKVLLNPKFQSRLISESFMSATTPEFREIDRTKFMSENQKLSTLDINHLYVLTPLYLSYTQTDRYWIFHPILNYYKHKIRDLDENKDERDRNWLKQNIDWRIHTGELATTSDVDLISVILKFNLTMMRNSLPYSRLIIRPNVEDYLCMIGSVFLDDDLFLEEKVSKALSSNIKTILHQCIDRLDGKFNIPFQDASKVIQPLNLPLADFFNKLVEQFEAVSYGDITFSNFLSLFITPRSDRVFRKMLFQEKVETCLSQLRMGIDSLWAPQGIFFNEKEKDPEMLKIFARSKPYVHKNSFLSAYLSFHAS